MSEVKLEEPKVEKPRKASEEEAADRFHDLMIVWKKLRKNMNYGAYARVVEAIYEFPLSQEKPKFLSEQELSAFKIGCTILDAKNVMIKKFLDDRRVKQALEQERKEKEEKSGEESKEMV